jgi:hypothetical protein
MPLKTPPAKKQVKPKRPPSRGQAKAVQPKNHRQLGVVVEYAKYFTAPQVTPQGFQILDLTDGGSVSMSSHT